MESSASPRSYRRFTPKRVVNSDIAGLGNSGTLLLEAHPAGPPIRERSQRAIAAPSPSSFTQQGRAVTDVQSNSREGEARRALVLHDRPLVVDLIELTLNHGLFVVRAATTWRRRRRSLPSGGRTWPSSTWTTTTARRCSSGSAPRTRLRRSVTPVLGLTRRGDLKTKLRAFDLGVDDILTVPFSPEELLARAIVITRRATGSGPADRAHDQARRDGDRHRQPRGARGRLGRST